MVDLKREEVEVKIEPVTNENNADTGTLSRVKTAPKTQVRTRSIDTKSIDVNKVDTTSPELIIRKKKSRIRVMVVFGIVDLLLLGYLIYQVVEVFIGIVQGS